jgi:peptidyl-tRNA hydrolase
MTRKEDNVNAIIFFFRETKIVVKGDTTSQLLALAAKANTIDIPNYLVQDAGRTQVNYGHYEENGV